MSTDFQITPAEEQFILAARQQGVALAPPAAADDTLDPPAPAPAVVQPPSILQQIQAVLAPFAGGAAGPQVAPYATMGELGLGIGELMWKVWDHHTNTQSVHKTLPAAVSQAQKLMETTHAGALDNPSNPTAVEITPVFQVGVKQVLAAKAAAIPIAAS